MHHRRPLQRQHPQFRIMRHLMPGNDADADVTQHGLADRFTAADFQQCAHLDAGVTQHLLGQLARSRARFTHQQTMPGKGGNRDRRLRRQRMATMHRYHQRVGTQHTPHQPCIFEQLRGSGEIDPIIFEQFEYLLRIADLYRHVDLRQALAEDFHQVEDVIRRSRGDAQGALALPAVAQEEFDIGFLLQKGLDHGQQASAIVT
ncbi:hypothetical protein D3C85_1177640 [compost metagenome]